MPLTKKVQVAYLLQRLHHSSVSFVGPMGSLSHAAAISHFGPFAASHNFEAVPTIADVFSNIVANKTAYGVVAFEDAHAGIVKETQLLLIAKYDYTRDTCLCSISCSFVEPWLFLLARRVY
jgi:prephenate dehydratase